MRDDLRRLARDGWLVTIALALAFGWALIDLVRGIASFIDHLMLHVSAQEGGPVFTEVYSPQGSGLTWVVHRHVITLDGIVLGLIEVAAVLLVAILVVRLRLSRPAEVPQSD